MKLMFAQRYWPPSRLGVVGLRAGFLAQAIAQMGSVSDVVMLLNRLCMRRGSFCPANSHPCDPAARDSGFLVAEAEQADPR
eukprot:1074691-Pyramimonas_sp.AAC.1